MGNAVKNIMLRAIGSRMAVGEQFEDIIKNYPRLTENEIHELKEELAE